MTYIISEFHPLIKNKPIQKHEVIAIGLMDAIKKVFSKKSITPQKLNFSRTKINGSRKKILYGEYINGSITYSFLAIKK